MGDLAIDTAVEGHDGRYTARLSRDWEIWGPNVGDFDVPLDIETTTLREAKRAQSTRVAMTQSGQPIFDAMVWSVGDVSGLEHDFAPMPDVPEPETIPTTAERM